MSFHRSLTKFSPNCGCLLILLVCFYFLYQQSLTRGLKVFGRSAKANWMHRKNGDDCQPVKNIAYLKTHKCSSSAFQNILFRYGMKHRLIFAVPETGNYFGRFIPFHSAMVPKRLRDSFDLNIFSLHTIWNHEEVKSVMPADTLYFTSIREPTSLFESLYSYAMDNTRLTLEEYIKTTEVTDKRAKGHVGYNQMSFDFGIDHQKMQNLSYVSEKITEADRNFDLVLVTERMEESLILLKHLLCWSFEDVAVIKLNARLDKYKIDIDESTKKLLEMRQTPDRLLYNHFYGKFDQLVKEFGEEEMAKELEQLRAATEKMMNDCGFKKLDSEQLRGRNKVYSRKVSGYVSDSKSSDCLMLASSELFLIDQIRKSQNLKIMRKVGKMSALSLLEDLPLGAMSLDDPKNLNETSEILKKYMLHSR